MKLEFKKRITICYVMSIFLIISISHTGLFTDIEENRFKDGFTNLKTSQSWNLGPFIISQTGGGNGTWDWAVSQDWCRGSGTAVDPYIIENVTINCGGVSGISGITIIDSDKSFIIQNSKLVNSGGALNDAGIKLLNSNNGILAKNNISYNFGNGIYFNNSDNNQILENDIHNNDYHGIIFLSFNDDNIISRNKLNLNGLAGLSYHGIFLDGYCEYNLINENILDNNGGDGIRIESNSFNNTMIKNDILNNNWAGILITSGSNDCMILENNIVNNSENGISISSSTNSISIIDNYFEQNGLSTSSAAIYAVGSSFLNISNNHFENNYLAMHLRFVSNSEISNNKIIDTITMSIYIEFLSHDNKVFNNYILNSADGIRLDDRCDNHVISDNTIIRQSSKGIGIGRQCDFNTVHNNYLFSNYYGIHIWDNSDNNNVSKSVIRRSDLYGLFISLECENSLIFENYFINNEIQVLNYEISNQWNYTTIGNYWSNYTGLDLDDDGIGDNPHPIISAANGFDNYPIFKSIPNIFIDDHTEFNWEWASLQYWVNGSGTEEDPYVIQNKIISDDWQAPTIEIRNSEKYFVISNCTLSTQGAVFSGITLNNVENCKIEGTSITNSKIGIELSGSSKVRIESNEINHNHIGLYLSGSEQINVSNNNLDHNIIGLSVYKSDNNYFVDNSILNTDNCILEYESNNNVFENNLCDPEPLPLKKLYINISEQIFTMDIFNITLFIYNGTHDGINAVSISIYWNSTNVSSSLYEIGNGYYMISINSIFTAPGEPGITLEITISKNDYEQLIYSSEIAVDPETVQKNEGTNPPPGAIPWSITAIILSTFFGIVCLKYYFKKRIK